MNNYLKYILMLVILTITAFAAHYLVITGLEVQHFWGQTDYSMLGLYTFATVSSLLAVVFILLTQYAMPKNLGFVFLGIMTIKVIAGFIYIQDGLGTFDNKFIEYNFLAVFFLYLFFDVFIAFKVLNMEEK